MKQRIVNALYGLGDFTCKVMEASHAYDLLFPWYQFLMCKSYDLQKRWKLPSPWTLTP